ncbi:hypothetical protein B0H12DRAFT_743581 [Mycena haematopus]|nr:hypothetical protein B0H12DRAFT_743581 [Mycena haematopus]
MLITALRPMRFLDLCMILFRFVSFVGCRRCLVRCLCLGCASQALRASGPYFPQELGLRSPRHAKFLIYLVHPPPQTGVRREARVLLCLTISRRRTSASNFRDLEGRGHFILSLSVVSRGGNPKMGPLEISGCGLAAANVDLLRGT